MDPVLTAEILKTCESIGFEDSDKYIAQPDWDVCVKDLLLYLRRDDDDHSIRRLLGQAQVLGRDILPLFKQYHKEEKVWELGLRLLWNLTYPALLLYEEEVPKNKKYLNYYYILEKQRRSYKEAFVDKAMWKILADKLRQLLNLEWDKRREQDKLTTERILILIRNILHVPADPAEERRADDDTSLHDRILMVMHLSGMFELLLYIASSETTQEYSILVLEILSWMLREQTGEQLAKTQLVRNEDDKIKDERELIQMREKEAVLKSIQVQKLPSRHSRFGGTFVVRDMKAPSGKDILCHKAITSVADLSLDSLKKRKKVASNRKAINDKVETRRSTIPIRIILKDFCASFLDEKYNKIMTIVKDSLNRGRFEDNDETYYLWALKFFMEFNRHYQFRLSYVRETMSTNTFHYVQTLLDRYQGMMVTDKEKIPFWSRRSHMSLKAYQELLFTLLWMDKDEDESVRESSRSIKNNVFYLPEYRELCLGLLTTYDPVKLSKLYLTDLIETNHLFLKMLQDYSSQNRRIMIKCKGKKKRKSTKGSSKKKGGGEAASKSGPVDDEGDYERSAVIGEDADNEKADEEAEKDEEDEEDEEEEEEERRATETEQEFDFKGFVLKYALGRVVGNYALLFQDWDTLKPLTLHSILKMFHRFVFDMGYPALICQASLFLTFQKILQVADRRSDLREAKSFFLHFWPKFAKLCKNKNMFIEILFWKTSREAQEIQDDYAELRGDGSGKPKKKSDWTKDEDEELELLVELYKDSPEEVKKAQKLIEYIMERWTWRPRSKRMFINRLTERELVDPMEFAKKKRPPKTWSDEEISNLRELFSEHKDSDDIMSDLLEKMEIKRSRKTVIQKMLEIDLIQDKNEVKRRRKRSKAKSRSQVSRDSDSETENREREQVETTRERNSASGSSSSSSSSDSDSESDRVSSDDDENEKSNISSRGPYDEERVVNLGKGLLEKGMEVALRWVKQSLKNYLEDIIDDPDSDESVPLVPINAECILAVANTDFKLFIRNLSILPPGEGETYWRIPSSFKKRDVDLRLDSLEKIFASNEENGTASTTITYDVKDQSSNLKKLVSKDESDSDSGSSISTRRSVVASKSVVSNIGDSDSESGSSITTKRSVTASSVVSNIGDSDNESRSSTTTKRSVTASSVVSNIGDSDSIVGVKKKNKVPKRKRRIAFASHSNSSDSDSDSTAHRKIPIPGPADIIGTNSNDSFDQEKMSTDKITKDADPDSDSSVENNFGIVLKKKRARVLDSDDE